MKLGILSDTHIKDPTSPEARRVFELVDRYFSDCDLIVHAGDLTTHAFLRALENKAPLVAVSGNMDDMDVRATLRDVEVLELNGLRLAIVHGWGPPFDLRDRLKAFLAGKGIHPDVVIFGHTHEACDIVEDGIRWLNPGSPVDRRFAARRSLGVLEISDAGVTFEIINADHTIP